MTEPRLPMPELIQRADRPPAAWRVVPGRAQRGHAWTNLGDGMMRAPAGDDPTSRCIRAHELMHAKVSPFVRWLPDDCNHLTKSDVDAAEEFRVNMLVRAAGFPVMEALYDKSEGKVGSRLVVDQNWNGLVRMMAATAGTRAGSLFLRGVKRRDPDQYQQLRRIASHLDRLWHKWTDVVDADGTTRVDLSRVASTAPWNDTVAGWEFTLEVAYLIHDHLDSSADDDDKLPLHRFCHGIVGDASADPGADAVPMKLEDAPIDPVLGVPVFDGSRVLPSHPAPPEPRRGSSGRGSSRPGHHPARGVFAELIERKLVLDVEIDGALGRRKRPAPTGTHPRHIHRLLVDPERRIFETRARGRGGVVLIDQSGSMNLEPDDLDRLLRAAPGCTVIGYSHRPDSTKVPNIWVIAHRGRAASSIPAGNIGNGVDGPAIEFAAARHRAGEPFVWVCDGHVTDGRDASSPELSRQCAELVSKHRIHMVPNVQEAEKALLEAMRGGRLPVRATGAIKPLLTHLPH